MSGASSETVIRSLAELGCAESGRAEERLAIGGVPATQLAERFGTPLYAYDGGVLERRANAVQDALGSRVRVLFALKANPSIAVARRLRTAGTGAEVASAGEIEIARAAGFSGEQVHFAGPGKSVVDLESAVEFGIGSVNLESASEAERLSSLARARGTSVRVAIRVQPDAGMSGARMRMAGGATKFGVAQAEVPELVRKLAVAPEFDFLGLHVYAGTQAFDAEAWVANAACLVDLARSIEANQGVEVRHLNFGGGFGVPVFEGDPVFDLALAGSRLGEVLDADRSGRDYFVELGRYLCAPAGVYLTRVVETKKTGDRVHVIVDGGMHQHAAAAGVGSIMRRSYPIVVADRLRAEAEVGLCIGGPLCTPADEFTDAARIPGVEAGDVIAILVSGAYGLTFSPGGFLSHPAPAEVLVEGGEAHIVRERGSPSDALARQKMPWLQ